VKQRVQIAFLIVVIAGLSWVLVPQLTGQQSLLGPRGERDRSAAPFQADEVPIIGLATPGPMDGETFDRERTDIFRYEVDPEIQRLRDAEAAEKAKRDAERRKKEQEAKRIAAAERARIKAKADREKAERDRLARLAALAAKADETPPPPDEPVRPVPPDFPYRYDGLVGPRADAIAILRDREDDYAYARAGQVLDEAFRVERVGQFKLVLSYVDPVFEGEYSQIPLRGESGEIGPKPTIRQ